MNCEPSDINWSGSLKHIGCNIKKVLQNNIQKVHLPQYSQNNSSELSENRFFMKRKSEFSVTMFFKLKF